MGPLTWIPPNPDLPQGGVASGGMDTLVLVWDLNTGDKVHTLKGHQLQVTGITFDDGDLVSSSIDSYVFQFYLFFFPLLTSLDSLFYHFKPNSI